MEVVQFGDVFMRHWGAVRERIDIVQSVRLICLFSLILNPSDVVGTGCLPRVNKELYFFISTLRDGGFDHLSHSLVGGGASNVGVFFVSH